jgi:uncharacterized protein (TIGR03437 family)
MSTTRTLSHLRNALIAIAACALPIGAWAQSYDYDAAGRLVRAAYAQGGGVAYTYDAVDNITMVAPLAVLPAPMEVDVTRLSETSARVSWLPDGSATGYIVERRQGDSGDWVELATLGAAADNYVDESLAAGENYSYRVSALNADGRSAPSKNATFGGPRRPQVSQGGVINGASFSADVAIAPGSMVSVFGQDIGIAVSESGILLISQGATEIPLTTELGDYSLLFGDIKAPLYFVGGQDAGGSVFAGQINAQVPWDVPLGESQVRVVYSPEGGVEQVSDPVSVNVATVSPALFTFDFGPGRAAGLNVVNPEAPADVINGSIPQPVGAFPGSVSQPAKLGGVVTLFANGLGPTSPAGKTGDNSLDALRRVTITPKVFVGGAEAQVLFAGLTPQFVGLYQINIIVPQGAVPGDAVPVVIQQGGLTSRADVTIAVRP